MSSIRRLIRKMAASCHWFYFSKRSRFEPVVALRRFDPFAVALCTAFETIEGLRFIQIGANDGISNDPIYDFATTYSWTGSLYEPMPKPFQALQDNYRQFPSCQPVNKAVSTSPGMLQFWYVENDGSLPKWTSQITSTDREHVLQHREECPEIIDHIQSTEVDAVDIQTIVNSESAVDLLCIDAEGLDHELLTRNSH